MSEQQGNYNATKKPQTIFRVVHDPNNPYVIIDKRPFEKPYMSWKAKGLLGYLLSRPDDWTIRLGDLIKRSTDKMHATRQALRELVLVGHVRQVEYRHLNGKYAGTVYEVHERPLYENPLAVYPKAEKRILNNIDSTHKEDVNDEARAITERTAFFAKLYSENIGAITTLTADLIRNMAIDYPDSTWYQPAFEIAIKNNARNLNYVDAVLNGWKKHFFGWKPQPNGKAKSNGKNQSSPEQECTPQEIELANSIRAERGLPSLS